MIIADGRDVLRHDFHSHSLQSACGIHTVAEILEIAAQKGVETVNICDHGNRLGIFPSEYFVTGSFES